MKLLFKYILFFMLTFLLANCSQDENASSPKYSDHDKTQEKPTYHLAIHPLMNPEKLSESYQPLIDYLNEQIPSVQFELEASRDYQAFEAKFRARQPEFILPNPWQTLEAEKVGYHVIAIAGDNNVFRGIFIVRKDSGIKTPMDLKGKVISYPSYTALAACIMPQRFLHDKGIDVTKDIINQYVGSQESSIMNVYLKESAAGATWPPAWKRFQQERPKEAKDLTVMWQTESLINNSVMARDDLPKEIVKKVSLLLYGLNNSKLGQTLLHKADTARFQPATNVDYEIVNNFITRFEKNIRPVE